MLRCSSLLLPMQAVQNFVREHAEALLVSSDGVDREFFVSFVNTPLVSRLRSLKALDLGKLVSFAGVPRYLAYYLSTRPALHGVHSVSSSF